MAKKGSARKIGETIVVPDVEKIPGYIARSSESRSGIVVPLRRESMVIAVPESTAEESKVLTIRTESFLEKIVESL